MWVGSLPFRFFVTTGQPAPMTDGFFSFLASNDDDEEEQEEGPPSYFLYPAQALVLMPNEVEL